MEIIYEVSKILIAIGIVALIVWVVLQYGPKVPELPGDFDEARMSDEEFNGHMMTIPSFALVSAGWEWKDNNEPKGVVSYYNEDHENYTIRMIDQEKIIIEYLGQEVATLVGEEIHVLEDTAITFINESEESKFD